MAYELDIQILGDEEINRRLRDVGDRALMAAPAMEEIADVFQASERALWRSGRSWAPNAAATIRNKGRNSPLISSGRLRSSLTADEDPNQIREIDHDSVKFGTKLWYAHFALGTENQPKREVIKLRATDRMQIHDIIREWVLHGVTAGLRF